MIVRSRITPASAGDEERRGNGDEDRRADVVRHRELHDVGRVGAEHHQLAVRHVDDAHDAERDRQADRDQHEHRAEAQAEEQRLDARIERARAIDRAHGAAAAACRTAASRLGEAAVRRSSRAARRAGCAPPAAAGRRASRRRRAAPAASPPSSAASARPVSISAFTPASVSTPTRCRSSAMLGSSSERSISLTAASRTRGVRARQIEARDRRLAALVAGGCSCRSWSGRRAAPSRRP